MRFIDHKKQFFIRYPILLILYIKILSEIIFNNNIESRCIRSLKFEINYVGKSVDTIDLELSGPKCIQIDYLSNFTEDSIIEFSNSMKIFIVEDEDISDGVILGLPHSDEVLIPTQTIFTKYFNEHVCSPSEPAELIEESETTYKCHILCKYRNYIDIVCVSDVSDSIGLKVSNSYLCKLEDVVVTNYFNTVSISNTYVFNPKDECISTLFPELCVIGVYLWSVQHNQIFIENINFNFIHPYKININFNTYGKNDIILKLDNISIIQVADISPCINNVDIDLLKLATLGDYATLAIGELANKNLKDIYFI